MIEVKDLYIGQTVRMKHHNGRLSIPMTVVGIFSSLSRPEHATLYLDFEDNRGDVWEAENDEIVKA